MADVTVHRAPDGDRIERVASGLVEVALVGDGPWELTEEEWAALQRTQARDHFTAEAPASQPVTAPAPTTGDADDEEA